MKTPRLFSQSRGIALVIVLAMVVLMTFLVVAFFSRATLSRQIAQSSAAQMRVNDFANGVLDTIVGDLKQEIADSSIVSNDYGVPVYEPLPLGSSANRTFPSMRPLRFGVAPLPSGTIPESFPVALIRQSTIDPFSSIPGFGNATVRQAQPVNSFDDPSLDGNRISPARWNRALLLPLATPSSPTDNTPDPATFAPPDWIYVTRSGAGVLSNGNAITAGDITAVRDKTHSNPNAVIGRYAYTIYDVGGLVDINVAGYPSSAGFPEPTSAELARKGPLGLLNIGELPGILNAPKLVEWRNNTSAGASAFSGDIFPSSSASPYIKYLLNPENNFAFLRKFPGDQAFLSRQDLIRYQQANPTVLTRESLRNLTTFSRDLNQPSWSPLNPYSVPSIQGGSAFESLIDYEAQANAPRNSAQNALTTTSFGGKPAAGPLTAPVASYKMPIPNRNVAKARWDRDLEIKDWDGETRQVKRGDPILARRFPLSRLDLFRQHQAANAGERPLIEKKIKYSFGLVPDTSAGAPAGSWTYASYTFSQSNNILSLFSVDELAGSSAPANSQDWENREPNFFEIIRLGLLRGDTTLFSQNDNERDSALTCLQIGTNIIDQYDADNFPTSVLIPAVSNGATSPEYPFNIRGIENIPYLSEMIPRAFRKFMPAPGADAERKRVWLWLEFEFWNPHSNAGTFDSALTPTKFRVRPVGGQVELSPGPEGASGFTMIGQARPLESDFRSSTRLFASSPQFIEFAYDGSNQSFADPAVLGSAAASNISLGGVGDPPEMAQEYEDPSGSGGKIRGLCLGHTDNILPALPANPPVPAIPASFGWPDRELSPSDGYRAAYRFAYIRSSTSNPLTLAIEFLDPRSGQWIAYQSVIFKRTMTTSFDTRPIADAPPYPGSGIPDQLPARQSFTVFNAMQKGAARLDPRGMRFPLFNITFAGAGTPGFSSRPDLTRGIVPYRAVFPSSDGVYLPSGSGLDAAEYPIQPGASRTTLPVFTPAGRTPVADVADNRFNSSASPLRVLVAGGDGILRPGDSNRDKDVHPLINSSTTGRPYSANVATTISSLVNPSRLKDRPTILNRPFYSVGELGYVFRDSPWKSINFSTSVSAEAAFLDLFSISESAIKSPLVAGAVNLNSMSPLIAEKMILGATRQESGTQTINTANARTIAAALTSQLRNAPISNRAGLVSAFGRIIEADSNLPNNGSSEPFPAIKELLEAPVRALAESGTARTWNLLVDVIVQTGSLSPSATSLATFSTRGERRVWLHVSIDRVTGRVIARQQEVVYE